MATPPPKRRASGPGSQGNLFGDDQTPAAGSAVAAANGSDPAAATSAEPQHPKIVVIDGHSLAYRSYFGMRELSTSRGVPTHAVYGFLRTLLSILTLEADEDATVVTFDAPAPTFRHEQFDDYKAGRAPMPDDLPQQLGLIKRLLDLLGVPRVEVPGLEADDLIGTIARRSEAAGYAVDIITSDRDALQLVGDRVQVRNPDRNGPIGAAEVMERYGVRPDQWVDYRALTGDASDNIPGVKGIGPATARALLERYGDLDTILATLDDVEPASQAKRIRAGLDDLELSRMLSRIVTDADIEVSPEAWSRRAVDADGLKAALQELEFGTFLVELGFGDRPQYAHTD